MFLQSLLVFRHIAEFRRLTPAAPYLPQKLFLFVGEVEQVIEQAQSLDSTVVKEKWESLDRVDTIFGPACVCGEKTWGIKNHVVASPQGIQLLRSDGTLYSDLVDVGCIP